MAANATTLCARVISISNRQFRGNVSRLRETHILLSSPGCKVSRLTIKWLIAYLARSAVGQANIESRN